MTNKGLSWAFFIVAILIIPIFYYYGKNDFKIKSIDEKLNTIDEQQYAIYAMTILFFGIVIGRMKQ